MPSDSVVYYLSIPVLKLLKMAKGIRSLLDTVGEALPQVGNLGSLFFLLFFIFAALGVELFGRLGLETSFFSKTFIHDCSQNVPKSIPAMDWASMPISKTSAWHSSHFSALPPVTTGMAS